MKWAQSVKEESKRNSRFVCMGCRQESLLLGGYDIQWGEQQRDTKNLKRKTRGGGWGNNMVTGAKDTCPLLYSLPFLMESFGH